MSKNFLIALAGSLVVVACCPTCWEIQHAKATNAQADESVDWIVTGRVTNVAGLGLAGATIEWGHNRQPFKSRQRVTTDQDGNYTIKLNAPDGRNHLAASLPGYLSQRADPRLSAGRNERNFALSPLSVTGHFVAGVVVDEQGKPISGVRVEAFTPVVGFRSSFSMPSGRDYFAGLDRVSMTDDQGRFRIENLPEIHPDEVQLSLRSNYRHINDKNYPVTDDLRIVLRGSGKAGVLQGRLVDAATGSPLTNANDTKIVRRHVPKDHQLVSEDGKFQLPGNSRLGRRYPLYIYAKGYAATEARLECVATDSNSFVDIPLKKNPPLKVRLQHTDTDEPIAGASVLYGIDNKASYFSWADFDKYVDGYHSLAFVQHAVSDQQGQLWFAEPEEGSRGTIIVWVEGYQRLMLKSAARDYDRTTGELVIRLQPESAFTGAVLKNDEPLAGVRVSVARKAEGNFHNMYEAVRTDAQGHYKFGCLAPGIYYIRAAGMSVVTKLEAAEIKTVDLNGELGSIRIHGKAERGITITLRPDFPWQYTSFSASANAAGEYEISGLKPGKYLASSHFASGGGYLDHNEHEVIVQRDGQQIDFARRTIWQIDVPPETRQAVEK